MKTPPPTPWQQWAQEYAKDDPAFEFDDIFCEDADRYSHAAWEECKRRVLEIIEEDGRFGLSDAYRRIKKL